MPIIACTCNQPQRLVAALAPVRAAFAVAPPISRWGLGYIQGGDVLLVRTPRASSAPLDLLGPLAEVATDCAIAQTITDPRPTPLGGTDNTPPFRFRRWLYAASDVPALDDLVISGRLLAHVPEFLRRNIRGRSPSELVFHIFLAAIAAGPGRLHALDDPNLSPETTRAALAVALKLVASELAASGAAPAPLGTIALSNGRSMLVARTGEEPVRLRKLTVPGGDERDERGVNAFRGYLLVAGTTGHADGFEEIAPNHVVLISRDLQVTLAPI